MANPHIVTFERDIENEIRSKSASLTDIAASSGIVENKPEKGALGWLILVVIALVILASGVGAYFYYVKQASKSAGEVMVQDKNNKTVEVFGNNGDSATTAKTRVDAKDSPENPTTLTRKVAVKAPLDTLFPNVFPYVGKNFIKVETVSTGYIITFSGYNEVYKGILDNENLFIEDILTLYGDSSKNTPHVSDVQVGSVDARTSTGDAGKKIYYTFIRPSTIIIGDNKETIISISDAILK